MIKAEQYFYKIKELFHLTQYSTLYTYRLLICHALHCHDPLTSVLDLLDLSGNVAALDLPSICRNARRPVVRDRNSLQCQVVRHPRISYEAEDPSEDYRNAVKEVVRNIC